MEYKGIIFERSIAEDLRKETEIFEKVLDTIKSETPVMIEIGSAWAYWSMMFMKRYPKGKSILIEPSPILRAEGDRNMKSNGLTQGIVYEGCIYPEGSIMTKRGQDQLKTVPILFLNDIFRENNIETADIIHCDAQGIEYLLLKNTPLEMYNNMILAGHTSENQRLIEKFVEDNHLILEYNEKYKNNRDGLTWIKK